jgi:cytochrome c(L), periplasmic
MTMRGPGFLVVAAAAALAGGAAFAQIPLFNVVTGEPLDLSFALEEGRDTEAVTTFLQTGVNIYNEKADVLPSGEELYLTACSGCHGHLAEGKIGPGLNDDYWTYQGNDTDAGLFRTIYGGAQGQMGPQYGHLTLDEMLRVMSWIRHVYTGAPETATWLTAEQRAAFAPYVPPPHAEDPDGGPD